MKITIDAGHIKGYNIGINPSYNEGGMAWALSRYLGDALKKYGAEVFYTRSDISKDLALELRGKTAHDNGSELFISLHSDGFTSPTAKGVSVFYSNHRRESLTLANALGGAVAALMGTPFRGAQIRLYGGSYPNADYYGVIRGAVGYGGERIPGAALLIEHGFHSNPNDCAWLAQDDNLQKLAETEARIIAKHYGLSAKTEVPASDYKALYETEKAAHAATQAKLDEIRAGLAALLK